VPGRLPASRQPQARVAATNDGNEVAAVVAWDSQRVSLAAGSKIPVRISVLNSDPLAI
jgi:metal-dependent HD superfamily phosphatase/phosphodiesterase